MTDERELGIKITGDIGDIQDKLSTLTDSMSNITDKTADLIVNVNDTAVTNLSSELNAIESDVIDLQVNDSQLEQLSSTAANTINQLDNITSSATDISASLNTINDQSLVEAAGAASDLEAALNNIDSAAINEAASAASALGSNVEEASKEADNLGKNMQSSGADTASMATAITGLSSSLAGFGGEINSAFSALSKFAEQMGISASTTDLLAVALGAVIVIGIAAYLADATQKAGEFNDSWSRLANAVGEGGKAIDTVKDEWTEAINSMKDETGRSAGLIREHIISMGTAGITSKDLIIDSFSGISGAAFVTGNDISTIEQAFKRIVSSGLLSSRQLIQFGITTDDIMKATGMTMEEVSAKFKTLDTDGRTALLNLILNQKYGQTANEAYKNSWQHVGDAINAAWKGLTIVIGQLIIPVVIPVLNTITNLLNGLSGIIRFGTENFNKLSQAVGGNVNAFAALFGPGVALLTMFNPLLQVVQFIQNNWSRLNKDVNDFFTMISSGDWGGALELLVNELKWAFVDAPIAFISSLPQKIGEFASAFIDAGKDMINWIVTGLTSLSDWLNKELSNELFGAGQTGGEVGGEGVIEGFMNWLDDNGWKIAEIVSDVLFQVLPLLIEVVLKIVALVGVKLLEKTGEVLRGWGKAIEDYIKDIPGQMYKWGQQILQSLVDGLMDKMGPFKDILKYISDHWPKSPPKIGPLSEITSAGMGSWISDVMQGGIDAAGTFNLNNIAIPAASTAGVVNQNRIGGKTEITVDMRGAVIRNESDAEKYGRIAGQAAAKEIDSDAIDNGVSVINYLR